MDRIENDQVGRAIVVEVADNKPRVEETAPGWYHVDRKRIDRRDEVQLGSARGNCRLSERGVDGSVREVHGSCNWLSPVRGDGGGQCKRAPASRRSKSGG